MKCDVAIIGAGPAGLAASIFGASEGLECCVIEPGILGGQSALSSRIENYLGFPVGLSGHDLARRAVSQAERFGVGFEKNYAEAIRPTFTGFSIDVGGRQIQSRACVLATGVQWRRLETPGADRLTGRGVWYGTSGQDRILCSDETVYIIGGANSAGQAAMNFSRFARAVVMVVRGSSLEAGMSQYLVDQVRATPNIEVLTGMYVSHVEGGEQLERIHLSFTNDDSFAWSDECRNCFVFIGAVPETDWVGACVDLDAHGFVVGPEFQTKTPGLFVVGDVRSGSVKRVAGAVGEGSTVVSQIHPFLAGR